MPLRSWKFNVLLYGEFGDSELGFFVAKLVQGHLKLKL